MQVQNALSDDVSKIRVEIIKELSFKERCELANIEKDELNLIDLILHERVLKKLRQNDRYSRTGHETEENLSARQHRDARFIVLKIINKLKEDYELKVVK